MLSFRCDAHTSTEHQRICRIALIKKNCAVDCGDANLVAVVLHPCNNSTHDAAWMKDSLGQFVERYILVPKTKDISIRYRLCRDAQNISNDSADACIRSTKRRHCGRVIVRLGFEW